MTLANVRRLVALPLVLLAASCSTSIAIDIARELDVSGGAGVNELSQEIDLSTVDELWGRRDDIEALRLDRVRLEVVAVYPGNAATAADVVVMFRPDGAPPDGSADVAVGAVDGASLAPGSVIVVPGSRAIDGALEAVLRGSGRFGVHLTTTADAAVDVRLSVRLQGSADVKVF